ncbi:hypothetical protein [Paramaledivibacter caminithermalis]|jgi:DNA-binding transcriptional regulator WhiA|uniref:Uncharacterized protein n=1 Tax=Paramaledivibacter caminithermalis (strain DSM 15212 / CIP 107654 / DViRD3) TaxID=1121301 RepID=A0A1M6SWH0_PARC5|nr:hypothetical protein [Paramaledivibacter caminithermalis]SHK48990.1 hypothetical protein SAMN02745912_03460 [Paramaledivibacter caminithermalis DSM 15212]
MKKFIPIEMDKVRNLRLGINAICQIEDMTGKTITKLNENLGIKEFRIILYCALKWEDKSLTLDKVGELMDEVIEKKGIDYLNEKLAEVLENSLGGTKKKMNQKV